MLKNKKTLSPKEFYEKKPYEKIAIFDKKVNDIQSNLKMMERLENALIDCNDSERRTMLENMLTEYGENVRKAVEKLDY